MENVNRTVQNSETIEFVVSDRDKILFPTENRFRGKEITGIEFVSGNSGQTTLTGRPMATANQLQNVFLTLDVDGQEKIKDFPANMMTRASLNGRIIPLNGMKVNASKSLITISSLTAFTASETSVVMIVYFK